MQSETNWNNWNIQTSITVAWRSSEYISRLANNVCACSQMSAIRLPIPSPEWAEVGTIDMYSLISLFWWNNATFKPCNVTEKPTRLGKISQPINHICNTCALKTYKCCLFKPQSWHDRINILELTIYVHHSLFMKSRKAFWCKIWVC